jgi:hypothetical protein
VLDASRLVVAAVYRLNAPFHCFFCRRSAAASFCRIRASSLSTSAASEGSTSATRLQTSERRFLFEHHGLCCS